MSVDHDDQIICSMTPNEESFNWSTSCFLLKNRKRIPVTVRLDCATLYLDIANNNAENYEFDEIASCSIVPFDQIDKINSSCLRNSSKHTIFENDVYLQLIIYPKNLTDDKIKRLQRNLIINSHSEYDDNVKDANIINEKIHSFLPKGYVCSKPILLILNPKSGQGKAMKIFYEKVKPIFDDFNIRYNILITKYANHATDYIRNHSNLSESYSCVASVSGDGLLFEVVNSFANCLDSGEAQKLPIPLSVIPAGSGNGLAHSLNYIYYNGNESLNTVYDCNLHIIHGQPTPMDIVRVTSPAKTYFSFLSVGWGLMADIDIESERLRFLGEPRFAIWSIYRSIFKRKYRGTLSYLPKNNSESHIPRLEEPIPDSWVTITDDFCLVYAGYQKYLNSIVEFAPESTLVDETIYLLYIKDGASTIQLIQFLLAMEKGLHTKLPFVSYNPVRAFRLAPEGQNDILTVDGEQIPCSPVQAEVIPQFASIMLRTPK